MNVTVGWSSVAIRRELKEQLRVIGKRTRQTPTRQVEMAVKRYVDTMAEDPEIAKELDQLELVKPGP
jgi:predicted DNA-binding protein